MTGPSGNSSFCFVRIAMFLSAAPQGNIDILGKQNELFPEGPVIKCSLFSRASCKFISKTTKPYGLVPIHSFQIALEIM